MIWRECRLNFHYGRFLRKLMFNTLAEIYISVKKGERQNNFLACFAGQKEAGEAQRPRPTNDL